MKTKDTYQKAIYSMMALIIIVIILALANNCNAQDGVPSLVSKITARPFLIIIYLVAMVAMGAIGDGLFGSGHKTWGHACKAAEVGMLLGGSFIFGIPRDGWLPYLASYVFIRFAVFDYAYNLTRGLPLSYHGGTSFYDNFVNRLAAPGHGWAFAKIISTAVGIALIIKNF